jgi:hypothetical protein
MQKLPRDLPAATTADRVIARLLTTAASQIGYREGRSKSGDWNNDNAFGLWYGMNGVSWCAQFVSWAASAAGIPQSVIPRHQYTPTGWNWFTAHDRDVSSPRAGDIFYVYGYVQGEGNRVHHVGIVEKVLSSGQIRTIEGNTNTSGSSQGNGIYRLTRTVSPKLRFARPNYAAAVANTKPPVTPTKPVTPPTVKPPVQEDDMPYTEQQLEAFAGAGVHGQKLGRSNVTIGAAIDTTRKDAAAARAMLATQNVQLAGLTAAVQALASQQGIDPVAVVAAVKDATTQALADLKITLSTDTPEA